MSWGDYVRNQIEKILLSEGFSVPVAQGGRGTERTYTTECLRQLKKGRFSMTRSDMAACGRKNKPAQQSAVKLSERYERAASRLDCSKKAKAAVFEHQRLSGAKTKR